jgi:hypothetical protein
MSLCAVMTIRTPGRPRTRIRRMRGMVGVGVFVKADLRAMATGRIC